MGAGFGVLSAGLTVRELVLAGFHFEIYNLHGLRGRSALGTVRDEREQFADRVFGLGAHRIALDGDDSRVAAESLDLPRQAIAVGRIPALRRIVRGERRFELDRREALAPCLTGAPEQRPAERAEKYEGQRGEFQRPSFRSAYLSRFRRRS